MKTLKLELPDSVDTKEVTMFVAAMLFDKGILSSGQAAKVVGIGRREFLETVGKYDVSIFQYDFDEVLKDLENARNHTG